MKKYCILLTTIFAFFSFASNSQNIAINTTGSKPDSSSILDVQSANKGMLFPRMTDSQRIAISMPATGLLVYQINRSVGFYYNVGTPATPNWILLARDNMPPVVSAVSDTTIKIRNTVDSITLVGSATDKDGTITSLLWSQVSGPTTAVIANAGSASAIMKGVVAGKYFFQLMATDNNGATGVKLIAVSITAPTLTSTTLQPKQNPGEVSLGYFSGRDYSNTTALEFSATAWTSGGSPVMLRGLFKFDLSSIPFDATIVSAKLTLYSNPTPQNGDLVHANAGSDNSMVIQRVISNWSNTVTWFNQPFTDDSSQIRIPHTDQAFLDLTNIDVTQMVKAMLPNTNYGFLIKLQNEAAYNSRNFCSSRYPDTTKSPKLEVQYLK